MHYITFDSETDFDGWRKLHARRRATASVFGKINQKRGNIGASSKT